jgi:S1-C subfamily serine protease
MLSRCYHQGFLLTAKLAATDLWLADVLGPEYVASQAGRWTAAIPGLDRNGDSRIGTGIVLDPLHVMTCRHVVEDMSPTGEVLKVARDSIGVVIENVKVHSTLDVAVLTLVESIGSTGGVVFREPVWADRVSLFGFPPIPLSSEPHLVMQSGEVVSPRLATYGGDTLFLFSAVARPGNSGGPVVACDGRLVGMVAQELSVLDLAGKMISEPFYAGLPTSVLEKALSDLGFLELMPIEDWE